MDPAKSGEDPDPVRIGDFLPAGLRSNPDLDPQHCLLGMDLARVISG